jgi:hypothetical protein
MIFWLVLKLEKSEQGIVHSPHQTQLETPPPHPAPKEEKEAPILHDAISHWLHEILFLKLAATIFGLD